MRYLLAPIALLCCVTTAAAQNYSAPRNRMVETQIQRRGIEDEAVLRAMRTVPRHRFVPERYVQHAYEDRPLPIGYGQTISQPYIVAYMTELVRPRPGQRILEIGTGSGYQAAVLAEIVDSVFTIEIVYCRHRAARSARVRHGDRQTRRRLSRLGRTRTLRRHRGDRRRRARSTAADRATQRRRSDDHSRRLAVFHPDADARRETERRGADAQHHPGPLRPVYEGELIGASRGGLLRSLRPCPVDAFLFGHQSLVISVYLKTDD